MRRGLRFVVVAGVLALATTGLAASGTSWAAKNKTGLVSGTLVDLPKPLAKKKKIDSKAPLRFGYSLVQSTLDPALTGGFYQTGILFDTLLYTNYKKELTPGLATKYTVSSDGLQVTFTLRDNAYFGDGTQFDATAVKKNIERYKTKQGSLQAGLLKNVLSVDVVDARTARFNLQAPDATLPYVLADSPGMMVNPKYIDSGADISKGPPGVGSSPYEVKSYTPGVGIVFEKRSGGHKYWDKAAYPHQRIEWTAIVDNVAMGNALATGAIDAAVWNVPEEQAKAAYPDAQYVVSPGDGFQFLAFRDTRVPLNVRQAAAYAVNRKADITSSQNCQVYASQMVRKGTEGYIKGYDEFAYNPSKAKSTLGGTTPSIEMIYAAGLASSEGPALVYQQDLKAAGFDVKLTPFTVGGSISEFPKGTRDAFSIPTSGFPDLAMVIQTLYFGNYHLAGPDFDKTLTDLLAKANALPLQSKERDVALQAVNKAVMEYATSIPLCLLRATYVSKPGVLGLETTYDRWAAVPGLRYITMTKVK